MIYEASFQGILKILFWIIVISFVIRLVARLALPHVLRKSEQVMRDRMRQMQEQQKPSRQEGEVTVETSSRKSSRGDDDYAEYVEIKD